MFRIIQDEIKNFYLALIFAMFYCNVVFSQTFTNNSGNAYDTWNSPLTKTISVSGLTNPLSSPSNVLRQVNIDFGDGSNSGNLQSFVITLQSPVGTTITVKTSHGSMTVNRYNVKFRDHSVLLTPQDYGSTKAPFDIGYYRTNTTGDFALFLGEDPNGTWTITITESTASEIAYNKVDLIFGSDFVYNDISASTANDACTGVQCSETGTIIIGTNNGYANPGPATDPSITSTDWSPSCSWNGAKNNSAWFKFTASFTTAKFTVSGVDNSLQILGFTNSGTCAAPTYSLVSGGCPTTDNPQYANGCNCNMQLNLSSLTSGNTYYIIVDGTGGAISNFYIEVDGGSAGCSALPIELLYFNAFPEGDKVVRTEWSTASEINNDYFAIERSQNGSIFELIGTVQGAGNSSITLNYVFYDEHPYSGLSYYRLRQVDYNGQFSYSGIRAVYIGTFEIIILYPNPSSESIQYLIASEDGGIVTVKLFDVLGREILHNEETIEAGITARKLNTSVLSNGSYLLQIFSEKQEKSQKQFVVK